MQALAKAYSTSVGYWRNVRGKQHPNLQRSFWDHFPETGARLDDWDGKLTVYERARRTMWDWLSREGKDLIAVELVIGRAIEHAPDLFWSVNSGYLWLDGGWGIAPVADDTDVNELKSPYEELLARDRKTPEAQRYRAAAAEARAAHDTALDEADHGGLHALA